MRGKMGTALMALGLVLVLGALSLQVWNQREERMAEKAAQAVMPALVEKITGSRPEEAEMTAQQPEMQTDTEVPVQPMKVEVIHGYGYIGFLSIPSMDLELPVMDQLDLDRLKIAPCRYSGTLLSGDLVIGGHNYPRSFGKVKKLKEGDTVLFTDVDGNIFSYSVVALEILKAEEVEEMKSGDWQLTLFTCTQDRVNRVAVRCVMTADE